MISILNEFRNRLRRQPSYPTGPSQWMTQDAFDNDPRYARVKEAHYTTCAETGQVFVKPFDGRFRHLSRKELNSKIHELQGALIQAGGIPAVPARAPRWMELEFLDNILEFEIAKPCGCGYGKPHVGPAVGEA